LDCGPRGIRTLDLLNAIEARSQLRYGPKIYSFFSAHRRSQFPKRGRCALWTQDLFFFSAHRRSQFPKRGRCALWAQDLFFFSAHRRSQFPKRGRCALWAQDLFFFSAHRRSQFPVRGQCALWAHKILIFFYLYPVPCVRQRGTQVDLEGFEPSTSSVRLRRAPTALQALLSR
jgi:hypothetical protein